MRRRIGTIHLQQKTTFRFAGYECAGWWKDTECEPQTAELHYSNDSPGSSQASEPRTTLRHFTAGFPSATNRMRVGRSAKTTDDMRNGNDIVLEYLTPVEQRHEQPDVITFVLFGECESGNCKSCPQMAENKDLGRFSCSCDCHVKDSARHKAGAA